MDDEKELVLGNKQLVSFFFVVLVLCGVFFALGYMIGRNSTKGAIASAQGSQEGSPASQASSGQKAQEPETQEPVARTESPVEAPPTMTPAPPSAAPASAPQTQPAHDSPVTGSASQLAVPEPGAMYLQVGALHRGDAETLVKTLREQDYPAVLATGLKPDSFRVLVGPYRQTAQVADIKARLKALGFADAFVLR